MKAEKRFYVKDIKHVAMLTVFTSDTDPYMNSLVLTQTNTDELPTVANFNNRNLLNRTVDHLVEKLLDEGYALQDLEQEECYD